MLYKLQMVVKLKSYNWYCGLRLLQVNAVRLQR